MATFQVDLRGLVDLLSRNLYSGPRVFVRELLQNSLDAITARTSLDSHCPAQIVFTCPATPDQPLICTDTGIGLTLEEAQTLLSTIGASSKRDELGLARGDFLGQFGIGLLSCFLVSNDIVVRSRSARSVDAPTIVWRGNANGTYEVGLSEVELPTPGTRVELSAMAGSSWFSPDTISGLVGEYGKYLPVQVRVEAPDHPTQAPTGCTAPWEMNRPEQSQWCQENFGFEPFDIIDLEVPVAGLQGLAYVVPGAIHPTQVAPHQVYLRRMLLSKQIDDLVEPWAYFVRIVVSSSYLRPTASREALFNDDLLAETRAHISDQIRNWLTRLAVHAPNRFAGFVQIHATGLKAVATHDRQMLDLVVDNVPFETTLGTMPLAQLAAQLDGDMGYFARTVDQFRSLVDVASAQEYCLINAGFSYDEEVIRAYIAAEDAKLALVDPNDILSAFSICPPDEQSQALDLLLLAQDLFGDDDLEVVLRRFEPATIPALYLPDPDLAGRAVDRASRELASGVWAEVLGVMDPFSSACPPRLVLNRNSALITRLVTMPVSDLSQQILRGLYVQCLLNGHHPLTPRDRAWASATFSTLIDLSLELPGAAAQ